MDRLYGRTIKTESGCLEFQGGRDKDGYGYCMGHGERKAHRLSYVLSYGPVPSGMLVRHKCDNPCCVNPEHLELGTASDNMKDRSARGRHPVGAKASQTKITPGQRAEIVRRLRAGETQASLAREFGVTPAVTNKINKEEIKP